MFIKCASIILYIISLLFLVYFSFELSLDTWRVDKDLNFLLLMIVIVFMCGLIAIACFNLIKTIKVWREIKQQPKDYDQILD